MAAEPMLGPGSAAAAGRRRGPRGENTDLAALARGAAHGSPGAGAGSFGPRAGTGSPPQLTRFLLLLVVLAAPILAAGAPLLARFEAKPGTVVEGPASEALHQLGECASGGIQRLLELVGASE
jgi:hypothetical protein